MHRVSQNALADTVHGYYFLAVLALFTFAPE